MMMKTYVSVFVKDSWRQGLRDENVVKSGVSVVKSDVFYVTKTHF